MFGDIEVAPGIKKRYLAHPTLFYYSPKTTINLIGDMNNTGKKSFNFNDYIEFEGGFSKLIKNRKSYVTLFKSDFTKYLSNNDFKANTNTFGAFNLRQAISLKTDLNTYVISNKSRTKTETRTINEYIRTFTELIENRRTTNTIKNFFTIGKITLDYESNSKENFTFNSFAKLSTNTSFGRINTFSLQKDTKFITLNTFDGISLKQNLSYNKKFSKTHIISSETTLSYLKDSPNTNWFTDTVFLENLIPLTEDNSYSIFQQKETSNTSFDFLIKDYWVLNHYNHIYTSIGINLVFETLKTQEEQRLTNGNINNFSDNGFGNTFTYRLKDILASLEYKFLIGIFTIKPAVFFHNYQWKHLQLNTEINNSATVLLPQLTAEAKINSSEKFKLKFTSNVRHPNSIKLTNNFMLANFNSVFKGNKNLTYERYNIYFLSYYKFSMFRGSHLNVSIVYHKKTKSIKNTTELQGIEQFRTFTMFSIPENNITGRFDFSKKINHVKYGIKTSASFNEYYRIVNTNSSKNSSKTIMATGKAETFFKKLPNFEIGYTYSLSVYKTTLSKSNFNNNSFFTNLDYSFLKDFRIKIDYSYVSYTNKRRGSNKIFNNVDASIFYQKEDSSWSFELNTTNIFNTQFKQQSSFTDFLISDQSAYILPRTVLLKISYKL